MPRLFFLLFFIPVLLISCGGTTTAVHNIPIENVRTATPTNTPSPTVIPTSTPTEVPPTPKPTLVAQVSVPVSAASVTVQGLTESEMRSILSEAGWPAGQDTEEALRVAYGESTWTPVKKGDSGTSLGLFQIKDAVPGWNGWWIYFGFDSSRYSDPVYNALLARKIFEYEQERGYPRWSNWTVKP